MHNYICTCIHVQHEHAWESLHAISCSVAVYPQCIKSKPWGDLSTPSNSKLVRTSRPSEQMGHDQSGSCRIFASFWRRCNKLQRRYVPQRVTIQRSSGYKELSSKGCRCTQSKRSENLQTPIRLTSTTLVVSKVFRRKANPPRKKHSGNQWYI